MPDGGLRAHELTVALAGRPVLRGVSCVVPRGCVTALVAPSGTGKSTLLRAFVRLVDHASGSVTLDGQDIRTLGAPALRRRVGLVAQSPVMLPGSVRENLAYALPDGLPDAAAREALEVAGLDDTFLARDAGRLSGGERARVALARALTRGPQLLLLDEPTAALDAAGADRIGRTLRTLAERGVGVCVATHDLAFAERWTDRREHLT